MSSLPLLTNREISTLSQSPESTAATEVSVDEQTEASDVLALEPSLQSKDRLRSIALQRLTEVRSANKELQRDKEMLMKDKHQYLTTIAELRATIRALQIGSNSDQRARNSNTAAPEASHQQQVNKPSNIKSAMPEKFNGMDRLPSISNWLYSVRKYLRVTKTEESDFIDLATTFLTGTALDWWQGIERTEGESIYLWSWQEFEIRCTRRFQAVNEAQVSLQKLVRWKQTGAIGGYIAVFQSLVQQIPHSLLTESGRVFHFIEGLVPELQKSVKLMQPLTVDEAIGISQRASVNSQALRPFNPSFNRQPHRQNTIPFSNRTSSQAQRTMSGSRFAPITVENIEETDTFSNDNAEGELGQHELTEMELSYLSAEQKKLYKEGRCFKCKKIGHRSGDCRSSTSSTKDQARM